MLSVAGSDNGICDYFNLPLDCSANFSLSARTFADGSVKGQLTDDSGDGSSTMLLSIASTLLMAILLLSVVT